MASDYLMVEELTLPRGRDEVFEFFSAAQNLRRMTPEGLRLTILTPQPILMARGTVIRYRLRLFGLPMIWESEITEWDPPRGFADLQVRGPYAYWLHTHEFEELPDGGTLIRDRVVWRLRFGLPGRLAAPLVRRHLERIFRHRRETIRELFSRPRKP